LTLSYQEGEGWTNAEQELSDAMGYEAKGIEVPWEEVGVEYLEDTV
jgi:hypothetical protein